MKIIKAIGGISINMFFFCLFVCVFACQSLRTVDESEHLWHESLIKCEEAFVLDDGGQRMPRACVHSARGDSRRRSRPVNHFCGVRGQLHLAGVVVERGRRG